MVRWKIQLYPGHPSEAVFRTTLTLSQEVVPRATSATTWALPTALGTASALTAAATGFPTEDRLGLPASSPRHRITPMRCNPIHMLPTGVEEYTVLPEELRRVEWHPTTVEDSAFTSTTVLEAEDSP
jgi:hypothetical protein